MKRGTRVFALLLAGLIAGLTLFFLLWLVPSGTAAPTTCSVPTGPYPTIQSAVDDAACDTIDVAAGTFVENVVIGRDVAIHGQTMTTTIVDGDAADTVFTIAPNSAVTLTNLTISNGLGGLSLDSSGSLVLNRTRVQDNAFGAGLFNNGGTVLITSTLFLRNATYGAGFGVAGGALYNDGGNVTISKSLFRFNLVDDFDISGVGPASARGGAIANSGVMRITESLLEANWAVARSEFDSTAYGGAISNNGQLEITKSTLTGNGASAGPTAFCDNLERCRKGHSPSPAPNLGGYLDSPDSNLLPYFNSGGGAIANRGSLLITDSILNGNHAYIFLTRQPAASRPYGILGDSIEATGGAIHSSGSVEIEGSALSHNSATVQFVEGGYGGAITNSGGTLNVSNSSLISNTAGAIGGALFNYDGHTDIVNSTLSANTAGTEMQDGYGGAIYTDSEFSVVSLRNSTVSDNGATVAGGGIYFAAWDGLGAVSLINTILANNLEGGDCAGLPNTSLGHNLDSDGSCYLTGPGDLPNTNPVLLPLGDYGGPTPTQPISAVSPAVDAGDDAACSSTDQRGIHRPLDGDGDGTPHCDIGAYEYDGPPGLRFYLPLVFLPN